MDLNAPAINNRLICALDSADVDTAKTIIKELDGLVSFYKIGMTLHLASGLEIIKLLVSSGKQVFLDLKYYDIPKTVELAVAEAARLGVDFLTVHANRPTIEAAALGRGDSALKILAVTVLTSLDQDDIAEMGLGITIADLVLKRAGVAHACGADGVICSPLEASAIKEATQGELLVVAPGIRDAQTGDDQKRTMSAGEALKAGADYLVVGRPITSPQNGLSRREAAATIIEQMQAALAG